MSTDVGVQVSSLAPWLPLKSTDFRGSFCMLSTCLLRYFSGNTYTVNITIKYYEMLIKNKTSPESRVAPRHFAFHTTCSTNPQIFSAIYFYMSFVTFVQTFRVKSSESCYGIRYTVFRSTPFYSAIVANVLRKS